MLKLKLVCSLALNLFLSGTFIAPSVASDLTRQFNAPFNNGTQGATRETADRAVQSGIQAQQARSSEQAIQYWQQAIELYRRVGEVSSQGRVYDLLGITYIDLGQLDQAENAFRRSLGIARDENNTIRQIYGYNNVGQVILQRGQTREAEQSFAEALRLARSIKHRPGQGLSLSNLGLATYAQGNYRNAIAWLEQAGDFRDQAKDPVGAANTLNLLGESYLAIGDTRSAFSAYDRAMTLAQQSGNQPNQFRAFDGLMLAYRGMGQENRYVEMLNQRLAMATEKNNAWQMLTSLKMIARQQQQAGKMAVAENYYQQAFSVAQKLNATKEQNDLREQIGMLRSRNFKW